MLRTMLEKFVRSRFLRRRLPLAFGKRRLHVSPDASLCYLKPNWTKSSESLFSLVRRFVKNGDSVWDIGANAGVFSFAAAHYAGQSGEILAVEADPFLASLLQNSANDAENVDLRINVLCAAVAAESGIEKFLVAARGRSSSSLEKAGHGSQAGGTRFAQYVPTITLDQLLVHFLPPSLIKIDIEGAEYMALLGASKLLSVHRPIFYVEVSDKQNSEVKDLFLKNNYRLYNGDSDDGVVISECANNTLAVPQESQLTNKRS
jgi:FkbM family methyltransferase